MFSKKGIVWLCICLVIIGSGILFFKDSKPVKQVLTQVNILDTTNQKKKVSSDQKKPFPQSEGDVSFTTTIQPKAVLNPNSISFSIDTLPRAEADKEADQAVKMIGNIVPQEFINRDPDGLIASYNRMLTQLLPDISDETRQKLMASYILEQYQREEGLKQYYEGKISWQAMQVAGWKTAQEGDAKMQSLLSDEEYLKLKGSSKADSFIAKVPHPYDDPLQKSEVFQNFAISQATNGVITTEEQLYQYINPDTINEVMKISRELERDQYFLSVASQKHEVTSEEFIQKRTEIGDAAMQKMRSILTLEESKILGLEK